MAPSPKPRALRTLVPADLEAEFLGDAEVLVTGVTHASTEVVPGDLFVCVPGARADGHDFAPAAIGAGAVALVVERGLDVPVPQAVVRSVRVAMGPIADALHGHPSRSLDVVGITGTNGKTTTTYLVESILRAAGRRTGVIGTTGVRIDGIARPYPRTTPEATDLQSLLRTMVEDGVGAVAMEVSSHGLAQHRVDGTRFACAVFTNLSQDHLDFHGSMEAYFAAKARLFEPAFARAAVINLDDPMGERLRRADLPAVTFAIDRDADLRATAVRTDATGSSFAVDGLEVRVGLRGRFNVANALAAIGVARTLGIGDDAIVGGIEGLRGVPGRMESVEEGQPFLVLVDYAHTPDGIDNLLRAARPLAAGRLIAVFGCGGDRDRAKRPLMARAAVAGADHVIVTSDNPRSEDPEAIIADILPGLRDGNATSEVEVDRRAAIRRAVTAARPGDVVVIAGKGHESGQEFADVTLPFDDRAVAAEELRTLGVAP